jgi:uncharacterized protein YjiS (DUF1127 family)
MTFLTVENKASPRPGIATGIAALCRWLGDALCTCMKAFVKYREGQNTIRMLSEFSDYELRDIGLSRTWIEAAVYGLDPDSNAANTYGP